MSTEIYSNKSTVFLCTNSYSKQLNFQIEYCLKIKGCAPMGTIYTPSHVNIFMAGQFGIQKNILRVNNHRFW